VNRTCKFKHNLQHKTLIIEIRPNQEQHINRNNKITQVKTEVNPPPPPPPQIQEHPQQSETFPTLDTILTITEGSYTDLTPKDNAEITIDRLIM
jgi:hypothetical protein